MIGRHAVGCRGRVLGERSGSGRRASGSFASEGSETVSSGKLVGEGRETVSFLELRWRGCGR